MVNLGKRRRIAVDIDGVVADILSTAIEYFGEPRQKGTYSFFEMFPMVPENEINQWLYLPSTYKRMPVIEGAREGILALEEMGWDVFYVTSRPSCASAATRGWLYRNDLAVEHCPIHSVDKVGTCKRKGLLTSVEDNLALARNLKKEACSQVFLINHEYNAGATGGVIRVKGWCDLIERLGG